jgi:hypothetical protein
MNSVFLLWHSHYDPHLPGKQDKKLIGVYSSKELAEEAQKKTELLPGFRDHVKAFEIEDYDLNKDHWTEGFATIEIKAPEE